MSLRVLIVDDEPLARAGVRARLDGHADVSVMGECGDGLSALQFLQSQSPDLLFIDVEMPGLSGLEVLEALTPEQRPLTVLLTAYEQFALRAFELRALDYLLKPVDDERFADALDRARDALALRRGELPGALTSRHATRFEVRLGHRVQLVHADAIDWIEAQGDYAGLHVGAHTHLLREPLQRLSGRLDPACFARIHRSTIVRLDRVAEMQPLSNRDHLLRLRDGTVLRASRTYVDALRAALLGHGVS
ncbi:LytTR family DNA-binding domain-containing protein [Rhodanobacter sp. AS-Z3]|uniref:LytR/AlgR family response regulator transcription factor n=1 Tax=Rhodanobacter sp. AS-Z3 TaxID=3031330 RepID=UPI002478F2AF|nr:LytTR family DNA-binding domain-containing protein [Rhodanobacter sp. AS-Z3]WEN15763.1 LytTR family DNA-binding domain-containing protein [Rhodanobacter sp. AS-Z3]